MNARQCDSKLMDGKRGSVDGLYKGECEALKNIVQVQYSNATSFGQRV